MNINNIFSKQLDRAINGVVKADQSDDATVFQELDEYVVTKELERHFRSFFESYSTTFWALSMNVPSCRRRTRVASTCDCAKSNPARSRCAGKRAAFIW